MIGVTEGTFYGEGNGLHGFAVDAPAGSLIQIMQTEKVDSGSPDLFLGTVTPPSISSDFRSGQYTRDHESGSAAWRWSILMETWQHDGRDGYYWTVAGDSTDWMVVTGQYAVLSAAALDTDNSDWAADTPGKTGTRWLIEGFGGNYQDWNVLMPDLAITDGTVGWEFGDTLFSDTILDVRQFIAEPTSVGAAPAFEQFVETLSGSALTASPPTFYDGVFRTATNSSDTSWYSVGGYFAYRGVIPPLRQNQRDDLRQNQRTSQQLTVRQRGYL